MNELRVLFLDDDPQRHECFTAEFLRQKTNWDGYVVLDRVSTSEEAVRALQEQAKPYDVAFLDHDLGGKVYCPSDEKSGYAVAEHIAHMPAKDRPKDVIIHSLNRGGVANMLKCLEQCEQQNAAWLPFGSTNFDLYFRSIFKRTVQSGQ